MHPAPSNAPEYTVSEISASLKRVVEDTFGYVRVRGEISGLKIAASGHAYLTLKDESAVLDGVCWKGTIGRFAFRPEDGLEVVCTGRITTYPGRSKYQLVIERMEPAGAGALMALLEARKKQLAAEGLFDASRKKKLPFLPQTIGIVTSPTGAVIRDILHRLADRFPVRVIVWPVLVQGQGAAEQIAAAIEGFNSLMPPARSPDLAMGRSFAGSRLARSADRASSAPFSPDLLIVARGGGSLEDLWAFNEEIVVRAAANSRIPLISAVGHETDTTLIDYAADVRAPTPSAAAEMAVPVRAELMAQLLETEGRMRRSALRLLEHYGERVRGLARGLPSPSALLEQAAQRLDDWSERLASVLPAFISAKAQRLALASAGLRPHALARDLSRHAERVREHATRLHQAVWRALADRDSRMAALAGLLGAYSVDHVLERGFALVKDAQGALVTSAGRVKPGETLALVFKDGEKKATAE